MIEPNTADVAWHKSSLSGTEMNCVEVAFLRDSIIAVRNSKHPDAGVTTFTASEWEAFIGGVKLGEFSPC